jgi:hypothetical protein
MAPRQVWALVSQQRPAPRAQCGLERAHLGEDALRSRGVTQLRVQDSALQLEQPQLLGGHLRLGHRRVQPAHGAPPSTPAPPLPPPIEGTSREAR